MFSDHARNQTRDRGIPEGDVEVVLARPAKAPGRKGATNFWGYGPECGFRILGGRPEETPMTKPLSVTVDLEVNAAYIRYAEGQVAGTLDVWRDGWVAADLDENGRVLGIEVLDLDRETLHRARAYAQRHGLGFPAHLEGVRVSV
jgi:uncharacterized protein YuzE